MKNIIILIILFVKLISVEAQEFGYKDIGPWYKLGSNPYRAAIENTDNIAIDANVVINGNEVISNSSLSVHGRLESSNGTFVINNSNQDAETTGLILKNGANSGYVLQSTTTNETVWSQGYTQVQTIIHSKADATGTSERVYKRKLKAIDSSKYPEGEDLNGMFDDKVIDTAKSMYGSEYGWISITNPAPTTSNNATLEYYVAPFDGMYRVTQHVYIVSKTSGQNSRVYVRINDNMPVSQPGIISITEVTNRDFAATVSGLISLKKGDKLRLQTTSYNPNNQNVTIKKGRGLTYIEIESLN